MMIAMKVCDILKVIYSVQHIIIYDSKNRNEALFDDIAYNVDVYDKIRRRNISTIYTTKCDDVSILMIEVK